jgi:hypothetical protein
MMVHLIAQTRLPDLTQALKLIEVHGIAVRHDEAVKEDRQPFLSERLDFTDFAQNTASLRNKEMASVVGVQALPRTTESQMR